MWDKSKESGQFNDCTFETFLWDLSDRVKSMQTEKIGKIIFCNIIDDSRFIRDQVRFVRFVNSHEPRDRGWKMSSPFHRLPSINPRNTLCRTQERSDLREESTLRASFSSSVLFTHGKVTVDELKYRETHFIISVMVNGASGSRASSWSSFYLTGQGRIKLTTVATGVTDRSFIEKLCLLFGSRTNFIFLLQLWHLILDFHIKLAMKFYISKLPW